MPIRAMYKWLICIGNGGFALPLLPVCGQGAKATPDSQELSKRDSFSLTQQRGPAGRQGYDEMTQVLWPQPGAGFIHV